MGIKGFGKRVLEARLNLASKRKRPVTQVAIAKTMGVTNVTVSRWEGDVKAPDLKTVERLAAILEVDPCWLAFGDDRGLLDGPADSVAPVPREPEPKAGDGHGVKRVKHPPEKPARLSGGSGRGKHDRPIK